MGRVAEWLAVFSGGRQTRLEGSAPEDPLLVSLMVHLALTDELLAGAEFDLLRRVCPDMGDDELLERVELARYQPFDFAPLLELVRAPEEREALLALAERMALQDGEVSDEEAALLARLRHLLRTS